MSETETKPKPKQGRDATGDDRRLNMIEAINDALDVAMVSDNLLLEGALSDTPTRVAADRVTLRLPDGIRVETRTVYRAVPEGLAEEDRELLRGGGVVALHSGAAAERLGVEFDRTSNNAAKVAAFLKNFHQG